MPEVNPTPQEVFESLKSINYIPEDITMDKLAQDLSNPEFGDKFVKGLRSKNWIPDSISDQDFISQFSVKKKDISSESSSPTPTGQEPLSDDQINQTLIERGEGFWGKAANTFILHPIRGAQKAGYQGMANIGGSMLAAQQMIPEEISRAREDYAIEAYNEYRKDKFGSVFGWGNNVPEQEKKLIMVAARDEFDEMVEQQNRETIETAQEFQQRAANISNRIVDNWKERNGGGWDFFRYLMSNLGEFGVQIPASIVTMGGSSFAQETGEIYLSSLYEIAEKKGYYDENGKLDLLEVIANEEDEPGLALTFGSAAGALDFVSAGQATGALRLADKSFKRNIRNWAIRILKSSGTEGITEGAQTLLEDAGIQLSADGTYDTDKINWEEFWESVRKGAIGGAQISTAFSIPEQIQESQMLKRADQQQAEAVKDQEISVGLEKQGTTVQEQVEEGLTEEVGTESVEQVKQELEEVSQMETPQELEFNINVGRTSREAKRQSFQEEIPADMKTREVLGDAALVQEARRVIEDENINSDLEFKKLGEFKSKDPVENELAESAYLYLGSHLGAKYRREGNHDKANEIAREVATIASKAGRTLSAASYAKSIFTGTSLALRVQGINAEAKVQSQQKTADGDTIADRTEFAKNEIEQEFVQKVSEVLGSKFDQNATIDDVINQIKAAKLKRNYKQERKDLWAQFKNPGKPDTLQATIIPGITPEQVEILTKILRTYIDEGVDNVKSLVNRIKKESGLSEEQLEPLAREVMESHNAEGVSKQTIRQVAKRFLETGSEISEESLSRELQDAMGITKENADAISGEIIPEVTDALSQSVERIYARESDVAERSNKKRKKPTRAEKFVQDVKRRKYNKDVVDSALKDIYGITEIDAGTEQLVNDFASMSNNVAKSVFGKRVQKELETRLDNAQGLAKVYLADIIVEMYYINLLSGASTQLRATIGAIMTTMEQQMVNLIRNPRAYMNALKFSEDFGNITSKEMQKLVTKWRVEGEFSNPWFDAPVEVDGGIKKITQSTWDQLRSESKNKTKLYGNYYLKFVYGKLGLQGMVRNLMIWDAMIQRGVMPIEQYLEMHQEVIDSQPAKKNLVRKALDIFKPSNLYEETERKLKASYANRAEAEAMARSEFDLYIENSSLRNLFFANNPYMGLHRGSSVDLKEAAILERTDQLIAQSMPEIVQKRVRRNLARYTITQDPTGYTGAIHDFVKKNTNIDADDKGISLMMKMIFKSLFPIIRVPTNFANRAIDYTPLGAVDAIIGARKIGDEAENLNPIDNKLLEKLFGNPEKLTTRERKEKMIRSVSGTLMTMFLFNSIFKYDEEDDEYVMRDDAPIEIKALGVNRNGTPNFNMTTQTGGLDAVPFSFRVKGPDGKWSKWIVYTDMPQGVPFAVIGTISDMVQGENFRKRVTNQNKSTQKEIYRIKEDEMLVDFMSIYPSAMYNFTISQSFSQGARRISNIVSNFNNEYGQKEMFRSAAAPLKTMVAPNLLRQIATEGMVGMGVAYPSVDWEYKRYSENDFLDQIFQVPMIDNLMLDVETDIFNVPVRRKPTVSSWFGNLSPFNYGDFDSYVDYRKSDPIWNLIRSKGQIRQGDSPSDPIYGDVVIEPFRIKTDSRGNKIPVEDRRRLRELMHIRMRERILPLVEILYTNTPLQLQTFLNTVKSDVRKEVMDTYETDYVIENIDKIIKQNLEEQIREQEAIKNSLELQLSPEEQQQLEENRNSQVGQKDVSLNIDFEEGLEGTVPLSAVFDTDMNDEIEASEAQDIIRKRKSEYDEMFSYLENAYG